MVVFTPRSSAQTGRCTPAAFADDESSRFSARQAASKRTAGASLTPWSCGNQGRRVQFDLKEESLVPADPEGKRKPGGGDGQLCRRRHLHLAASAGRDPVRCRSARARWWSSFGASRVCPADSRVLNDRRPAGPPARHPLAGRRTQRAVPGSFQPTAAEPSRARVATNHLGWPAQRSPPSRASQRRWILIVGSGG